VLLKPALTTKKVIAISYMMRTQLMGLIWDTGKEKNVTQGKIILSLNVGQNVRCVINISVPSKNLG